MTDRSTTSRRSVLAGGALLSASAVGLSACSGSDDSAKGGVPSKDPDADVTITFMHAMASGTQKAALKKIVKNFMKKNSKITIKLNEQPDYDTLQTKISAQTSAGKPPTIAQVYGDWAAEYAESKVIESLDDYVKSVKRYSDFFDGIKDDLKLTDGKTWMWPFNKSVVVQYYNTELVPHPPKTWDDFEKIAKKVSKGKIVALSMDPGSSSGPAGGTAIFEILAEANGDAVFADDGAPQFEKSGVKTALQYLVDMKKAGALSLGKDYPGQTALGSATGAFDISSVASYPFNKKAVGDKYKLGVAQIPKGPKKQANQLAGTNICLFSDASDNEKAAAWKFLQYLTEPEQQAQWAIDTGYLPVCQAALKEENFKKYAKENPFVAGASKQLDTATALPPKKWVASSGGYLAVAIQQAVNQGKAVKDVLATAQHSAEKAKKKG